MVSKMVRSMITTVINPFDGLISRYFVTLDPVLNSYYEMAQPITFAGDFEVEVEFSTSNTTSNLVIASGNNGTYIQLRGAGDIALKFGGTYISFNNLDAHKDGKLHKIKGISAGNITHLYIDGIKQGSGIANGGATDSFQYIGSLDGGQQEFDGIIANAKFTDKSGASDVVTTFRLGNSPAAENYIYGGELVANGDFSDGATGWNLGTGWALVESKMTKVSGVNSSLRMTSVANTLTVGGSYEVSFSIEHTAGILDRVYLTGSSTQFLGITASGDYSYVLIADSTSLSARFISGSSFEGSIDNISVKEITNYTEANAASEIEYSQENVFGAEEVVNGDFANGSSGWTGLEVVNGYARVNSAGAGSQSLTLTNGKTYRLTLDINAKGVSPGFNITNSTMSTVTASGGDVFKTYSVFFTVVSTGLSNISLSNGSQTALWDNISVKEITNAVEYKNIPQSARELYSLEDDTWVGSDELVTNGDFATDSDWVLSNGATISNGKANIIGDGSSFTSLSQGGVFEGDKQYSINLDVVINSGLGIKIQSAGNEDIGFVTTTGNYTFIFNQLGGTNLIIGRRTGGTAFNSSIDNVSIKEIIEVADFIEPVTQGMTLTEAWTTRGTSYSALQNATSASVRVDATISNTDDGILMESGGSGLGLVLYVYNGILYFQCGKGDAYGTFSGRAEVSYTLPVGESDYIIEWSADTSNAVLYVNGLVVGSQTFSYHSVSGAGTGTLGEVDTGVAVNRGGWTTDGSGVYTNTITKCDIFNNQITSDV